MPYKDKEQVKQYWKNYYTDPKHREEHRERKKRYHEKNREKENTQMKNYYAENKDKFKRYQNEISDWFADLKLDMGCAKCGYNKCVDALVFHHVNGEDKTMRGSHLNHLYLDGKNFQKYLDEFHKCILLCKNCHDEIHNL